MVTSQCLQASADLDGLVEAPCNRDLRLQHWTFVGNKSGLQNAGASKCLDANAAIVEKTGSAVFMYHCFPENRQQSLTLQENSIRWDNYCIQGNDDGSKLKLVKCSNFLENVGRFEQFDKHSVTG